MMVRIGTTVVVLLVAAAAVAAQARPHNGGLASVANVGRIPVRLAPAMRTELRHAGVAPRARLLAVRNGRAFVRLGGPGNDHCYGVTKRAAAADRFGYTCWDDFPSAAHPILDLSTFGSDNGGPMHVLDAEGIAADGIASVAFTDANGTVVARSPVSANVYSSVALPDAATRIVALDRKGRMLFAVPK